MVGSLWEGGAEFEAGGLAKIAVFTPILYGGRRHHLEQINWYYGLAGGAQALLITGVYNFRAYTGIAYRSLDVESSVGRYYAPKVAVDEMDPGTGPMRQDLLNFKLGVRIQRVRLRLGTSFVLGENYPDGQANEGLLPIGRINGRIYSAGVAIDLSEPL